MTVSGLGGAVSTEVQDNATDVKQLVIFELAGGSYGLDIQSVRENQSIDICYADSQGAGIRGRDYKLAGEQLFRWWIWECGLDWSRRRDPRTPG